jgi:hypothetical protein
MTLGNMRANGVHSIVVCCWACHHEALLSCDLWPDDFPLPKFRLFSAPFELGEPSYDLNGSRHESRRSILSESGTGDAIVVLMFQ